MKIFKWILYALGAVIVLVGCFAAFIYIAGIPTYTAHIPAQYEAKPSAERISKGAKIATLSCTPCHISNSENRLSGKLVPDIPKIFGTIYSKNITQHPTYGIGAWSDAELAYFIRTGIRKDGTYAPPYMPKLPIIADEDLKSLIAFLRSDAELVKPSEKIMPASQPSFMTKFLSRFVFKPYPYQEGISLPPVSDSIAHGKYLADAVYGCTNCHSASFQTNNELNPPANKGYCGGGNAMPDLEGKIINSANITFDETGLGNWTVDEFITAVKYGKGKNGSPLRYPMEPKTVLDTAELRCIYQYLQTVPKIKNAVARN